MASVPLVGRVRTMEYEILALKVFFSYLVKSNVERDWKALLKCLNGQAERCSLGVLWAWEPGS